MVRLVWIVNGLTVIAVAGALLFQSNQMVFDYLAVATKICMAVSYAALSWSTLKRSPELETAVLAYLAVVYMCAALHLMSPAYLTYAAANHYIPGVELDATIR